MSDNKRYGYGGESMARAYLEKNGYKILETNFTALCGEIDIICQKSGELIFVEVKRRLSDKYGAPAEAVTRFKQRKISQTAALYIKKRLKFDAAVRFDVIEIADQNINHIEYAFLSTVRL
jgi:putative endonuclease